jgi:hypothetical protein
MVKRGHGTSRLGGPSKGRKSPLLGKPARQAPLVGICLLTGCNLVVPTRNVAPEATLKLGKETTELSKGQFCVSLDGSASHDKASVDDTTGALSAFVWDFGDGSPVATLSAPQPDTSADSSTLSQRCFESIECTA